MKNFLIAIVIIVLIILGIYYFRGSNKGVTGELVPTATSTITVATSTLANKEMTVIGQSVEGRDITAYHYGTGADEILLVGGLHGGYEWNTVSLAYEIMDYLKANPNIIPTNLKVTVIPVLNPDGLTKTVGTAGRFTAADVPAAGTEAGRFNANKVDLNRNFACDWQTSGKWQSKTVSGGTAAFSEPETVAVKNYIESNKPKAVVAYFSAAGGVYSSNCHTGVLPETKLLTSAYAQASGYPAFAEFDFYETTGDFTNWLAKEGTPSISVLLTNHSNTEWAKNKAGVEALLKYYTK